MLVTRQRRATRGSLAALILAALAVPGAARAEGPRRFALVVANNEGGPDTRPLRYAHDDARRIRDILVRLGDVRADDARLLLDRTADELRGALDALEPRVLDAAARGERPVFILYYSGHAKDGALRLGRTAIALDEVKQRMARSSAEVRIGLLDSCRSGAITRTKGARKAPAFEVDTGATQSARGLVLLASSAADEDSQESDELSGSFFSHHLASGLMGGADTSGDGRVSLAEAYAYAYERTVADTAGTAAGPQHPTFSYDLAGNGDVVLTDFAARREGLVIPAPAPAGSYFLVDARGAVAAEIAKLEGVERRIALAPGSYHVKRRLPDKLRLGQVEIAAGRTSFLDEAGLRDAPFSDDPVKGVSRTWEPEARWAVAMGASIQSFFAGPFPSMPVLNVEVELRDWLRRSFSLGFDVGLGGGKAEVDLGSGALPYRFSELTLGVSIVKEWGETISPFVGGRMAVVLISRDFEDPGIPNQGYFAMTPGLAGGLRIRLTRSFAAAGRLRLHYLYYNVDSKQSLGYVEGALVLSYEM